MKHLPEHYVEHHVKTQDIVGQVRGSPTIDQVYFLIIDSHEAVKADAPEDTFACFECRLFATLWPGSLLTDPRLQDANTRSFRRTVIFYLFIKLLIELLTLSFLMVQGYQ